MQNGNKMKRSNRKHIQLVSLLTTILILTSPLAAAQDMDEPIWSPVPYDLTYEAKYKGFSTEASRTLEKSAEGVWSMESFIELTILGQTITSIRETASLESGEDRLLPLQYHYVQRGIGSRSRSILFDRASQTATASDDDNSKELTLEGPVLEDMSGLLWLRQQFALGATEVRYSAVDRNKIEEYVYQAEAEETIETPLGRFNTIKINRVRDPGSERSTSMWLAPEWDYIVVRLEQIDPDGSKLELSLSSGNLNGKAIVSSL